MKTLFKIITLVFGILIVSSVLNTYVEKVYRTYLDRDLNSFSPLDGDDGFNTSDDNDVSEESKNNTDPDDPNRETENGGGSEPPKKVVKVYSKETKEYFDEIAYGREFDEKSNSLYKWNTDVKIYVDGEKPEYLMSELRRVIIELNDIIDPIDIKIVSSKSQSNFVIYFGDHKTFGQKYNITPLEILEDNWGLFELYYGTGVMYVDLQRNNNKVTQKHLLREELTQSLGLVNDSYKYPESIFYQGWTSTTEFAPIDRELIDMLYNN
jgi:hypothetical protein